MLTTARTFAGRAPKNFSRNSSLWSVLPWVVPEFFDTNPGSFSLGRAGCLEAEFLHVPICYIGHGTELDRTNDRIERAEFLLALKFEQVRRKEVGFWSSLPIKKIRWKTHFGVLEERHTQLGQRLKRWRENQRRCAHGIRQTSADWRLVRQIH